MKALWLTSWYPTQFDKFNGDFIQRHAYATSAFCNVSVIHVEGVPNNFLKHNTLFQSTKNNNLSETILLFKKSKLPVIGKFISYRKYIRYYKQQVQQYIHYNGKPDIVHVHVTMKAGLIALWIKQKYRVPYVVTEHWSLFTGRTFDSFSKRSIFFRNATKQIFKKASVVLPVSKSLGDAIDAITPVHFTVVYNCVNTDYFFYDESASADVFTFIHVSTLDPNKNPQAIIDAFIQFHEKYANSKLIMVGHVTPELSKYLSRKKFPVDAIQFTGLISYEHVAQHMQESNSLILFSYTENMPCVMLEALCCGLPVISSDVGGVSEVINKENGLLVNEYTIDSLLQSMVKLYQSYRFYNRKKIADEAKANFAYDVIGNEILLKYKEVTNINN